MFKFIIDRQGIWIYYKTISPLNEASKLFKTEWFWDTLYIRTVLCTFTPNSVVRGMVHILCFNSTNSVKIPIQRQEIPLAEEIRWKLARETGEEKCKYGTVKNYAIKGLLHFVTFGDETFPHCLILWGHYTAGSKKLLPLVYVWSKPTPSFSNGIALLLKIRTFFCALFSFLMLRFCRVFFYHRHLTKYI